MHCATIKMVKPKSALHVSGDELFHSQEHFLTVYTAFGTTLRYCCRREFHLNLVASREQYRCIVPKAVYTAKQFS